LIIFITADPTHPTKNQIVQTFKHSNILLKVIPPSICLFKLRKLIQSKATICLLAPDHPRAFKICRNLVKGSISCINLPEITLLCRNRIGINTQIRNLLDRFKYNHPNAPILIPKSHFYPKVSQFFSQARAHKVEFPIVIKYPINHSGVHFVRLINHLEDIKKIPKRFSTHGIYTEQYVNSQELLLKCYNLGDTIITQEESNHPTLEQLSKEHKELINSIMNRKTIQTPLIIREFVNFITKELPISIFGVDFLITNDNSFILVDFNDFPGARGIPNAGEIIANFILREQKKIESQLLAV